MAAALFEGATTRASDTTPTASVGWKSTPDFRITANSANTRSRARAEVWGRPRHVITRLHSEELQRLWDEQLGRCAHCAVELDPLEHLARASTDDETDDAAAAYARAPLGRPMRKPHLHRKMSVLCGDMAPGYHNNAQWLCAACGYQKAMLVDLAVNRRAQVRHARRLLKVLNLIAAFVGFDAASDMPAVVPSLTKRCRACGVRKLLFEAFRRAFGSSDRTGFTVACNVCRDADHPDDAHFVKGRPKAMALELKLARKIHSCNRGAVFQYHAARHAPKCHGNFASLKPLVLVDPQQGVVDWHWHCDMCDAPLSPSRAAAFTHGDFLLWLCRSCRPEEPFNRFCRELHVTEKALDRAWRSIPLPLGYAPFPCPHTAHGVALGYSKEDAPVSWA
jgi:hypothetical protein